MDEKPKSIWKRAWHSRCWFRAWLILVVMTFVVTILWASLGGDLRIWDDGQPALVSIFIASLMIGAGLVGLWIFIRWLGCGLGCGRNRKRLLFGAAGLATVLALFYAEEDWRGWHAWNQFKHEWEAKGEKFDFKDFVPPPVPDDQNFAMAPIVYSSYGQLLTRNGKQIPRQQRDPNFVNRLAMEIYPQLEYNNTNLNFGSWQKAQLTDLRPWQEAYRHPKADSSNPNDNVTNEFPVAPQPQTPAADVLLALSRYDAAIEELRQASRLPGSRFPLNYDDENPSVILLPHLAALKRCSQVLQLRSLAELQNGQSKKALADLKLALGLADSIRTEPFLISHLVRIALLQITLQPIYEGLAEHRWSDEQLVALDAELAKLDFLADHKFAMRGEMAEQSAMFDYFRKKPEGLMMMLGFMSFDESPEGYSVPFVPRLIYHTIPNGWLYQNQLNCARPMVNYYIPTADTTNRIFSVQLCQQGDNDLQASRTLVPIFNYMKLMMTPTLGAAARKFAYMQASVDLSCTAIALERYRLAHEEFPESLAPLAPQFIAKVPHDVIGGQPLKYRREADGLFVLYSVGWNEADDGGVVGLRKNSSSRSVDISQGDWVWRYPTGKN